MILSDIKDYMQKNRVASINDLAMYFDADPDVVRDMLAVWIRKGKVRQIQSADVHCNKCAQCHLLSNEIYEWIGEDEEQ